MLLFQTLSEFAFYGLFYLGTLDPKAADGGEDEEVEWLRWTGCKKLAALMKQR